MMRTSPPFVKASLASNPASLYDLPREYYEGDPANVSSESLAEDEVLLESIAHPQSMTLSMNAQRRVRCLSLEEVLAKAD